MLFYLKETVGLYKSYKDIKLETNNLSQTNDPNNMING